MKINKFKVFEGYIKDTDIEYAYTYNTKLLEEFPHDRNDENAAHIKHYKKHVDDSNPEEYSTKMFPTIDDYEKYGDELANTPIGGDIVGFIGVDKKTNRITGETFEDKTYAKYNTKTRDFVTYKPNKKYKSGVKLTALYRLRPGKYEKLASNSANRKYDEVIPME